MTAKQIQKKFLKINNSYDRLRFIIENASYFCIDIRKPNSFVLRGEIGLKDIKAFEIGMDNQSILINLCAFLGVANIDELE